MHRTVPNTPRVSTLKKSQAYSVSQWLLRNCSAVSHYLLDFSSRYFVTVDFSA
jgi:hypothetical protein